MNPDLSRAQWRKSSMSANNGQCVEVAHVEDTYAVRDSKNPHGPKLLFTAAEWQAFLNGAKAGEFDYDLYYPPQTLA